MNQSTFSKFAVAGFFVICFCYEIKIIGEQLTKMLEAANANVPKDIVIDQGPPRKVLRASPKERRMHADLTRFLKYLLYIKNSLPLPSEVDPRAVKYGWCTEYRTAWPAPPTQKDYFQHIKRSPKLMARDLPDYVRAQQK